MKRSRNLLFIKNGPKFAFARSWIMDDFGTHSRTIGDVVLLGEILSAEEFDVILIEQRSMPADLIPAIESMRHVQPHAKLVVMSGDIGISEIKQAMRYNVHDIFLPPFDLAAVIERVETELAKIGGVRPLPREALMTRWSELARTLDGDVNAVVTQIAAPEEPSADAPEGDTNDPDVLKHRLEEQGREFSELRKQLEETVTAKAKLADQVARLSVGASALRSQEARMRELESELASMRERPSGSPALEAMEMRMLRDTLEAAQRRVQDLEAALAAGGAGAPAAGADEAALQAAAERIQQLETELQDANDRFEAAGQAFASEIELVMAREAEVQTALAEAEKREHEARTILETAGDAFGRADETIERDRAELQKQRELVAAREADLEQLAQNLVHREALVGERSDALARMAGDLESGGARMLEETGDLIACIRNLESRQKEIGALAASLRGAPVGG